MAITTQDKLIAALAAGTTFVFPPLSTVYPAINNATTAMGLVGSWTGSHRTGSVPSTAQFRTPQTCGAATAGAMPLPTLTAGNRYYLGSVTHGGMTSSTVMILDRLAQVRIDPTLTSAQTFNMTLPARITSSVGVMAFFEYVANDMTVSATMPTTTLGYTNSGGASGRSVTGHTHGPTSTVYERQVGGMVPFQMGPGDRGVQSVQSVTLGEQMSSGMGIVISLCRVLYVNHQYALQYAGQQLGFYDLGGIDLGTDPCVFYAVSSGSGNAYSPPPTVMARIIQG